jgi:hypothetical protein
VPGETGRTGGTGGTGGERESYPTTAVQRRWLDLLPDGYGGIDLALEITGVNPAGLAEAITRVVDRHSALRTTFHRTDGGWTQRVRPAAEAKIVDLTELRASQQHNELAAINESIAERWFDVSVNPPFEVTVVALGPDRSALLLHAHHVTIDGWSSSLFLRDVVLATEGRLSGRAPQYVDHAAAEARFLAGDAAERALAYWRDHFRGAPAPTRITPSHDVADETDRGDHLPLRFPPDLVRLLKERAVAANTTVFALMMTAFGMLVHHRSGGRTDLVVGTTSAGRTSIEAEETVGVFVNPLPLRLRVAPDQPLRDLVGEVHRTLLGFHEHGHVPMESLVRSVEPFVGAGLNDTFHCYLLYQNYWRPETGDIGVRRLDVPGGGHHKLMREFEIVLEEDGSGRLSGELWYLPSRFSTAAVRRWGEQYAELLHAIAAGVTDVAVADVLARCETDTHEEEE